MYNCSLCPFFCKTKETFFKHLVKRHKHTPNFIIHCSVPGCGASYRHVGSFRMHLFRKHHHMDNKTEDNTIEDNEWCDETICNDDDPAMQEKNNFQRKVAEAQYILKLKAQHNLPQNAINDIISWTKHLITEKCQETKQKLITQTENGNLNNVNIEEIFADNSFNGLETEYKQEKFFRTELGFVRPKSVKLGEIRKQKNVNGKYQLLTTDILGFYVPFDHQLQTLLSMPEVQESLKEGRHSKIHTEYADIFDGLYYQKEYFQSHPNALLFSIYYDDFEIVNPIGSHKKKHKLSVFYWNLLNLSPELRFKIQATQLLAVTKTIHLKTFGMSKLLSDFVQNMQQLHNGKIFRIQNNDTRYYGTLFYAIGDTPAAQYLGGFKEGVSFAHKPCRTCEVTHDDLNLSRFGNQFRQRDLLEHYDRCDIIEGLRGETKQYWSKLYGITSRSVLCDIPEFDVTKCILHDPMHVLLEGIVKMEIQLMLSNFIDKKRYFSLHDLNNIIRNFNYSVEEIGDKPQEIEKKNLDRKNTFPMTAIETKNFMVLLPYMIGDRVPENDKIWNNFIRLLQITLLVISPISSNQCIDSLHQLIASHNHNFKELFPEIEFTPKLHILTHFPMQIKLFGPARNHWCLRLEAKHGLVKNKKWKNFKSISKSIAFYHQRWMCLQQTGSLTDKSEAYLYKRDEVKEGPIVQSDQLSEETKNIITRFNPVLPVDILITPSVNLNTISYHIGTVLVISYSDNELKLGMIKAIYVIDQVKYFELEELDIQLYVTHLNCFACVKTNKLVAMVAADIAYRWPQKCHFIEGVVHVMLQNVDFSWT